MQGTFLIVMSIALYGVFLAIQNLRHREYFVDPQASANGAGHGEGRSLAWHVPLLLLYLVAVLLLAKQLAVPINYGIHVLHAPAALGGFLVSVLVLAPESPARLLASSSRSRTCATANTSSTGRPGAAGDAARSHAPLLPSISWR